MLGKMDEMAEVGGMSMSEPFIVGETIKIIEGPFNDFNGVVEHVDYDKNKFWPDAPPRALGRTRVFGHSVEPVRIRC